MSAPDQELEAEGTPPALIQHAEPLLRVHRGNPSDEELAALTAVVVALAAGAGDGGGEPEPTGGPWRRMPRWPPAPGPSSWRWAAGP